MKKLIIPLLLGSVLVIATAYAKVGYKNTNVGDVFTQAQIDSQNFNDGTVNMEFVSLSIHEDTDSIRANFRYPDIIITTTTPAALYKQVSRDGFVFVDIQDYKDCKAEFQPQEYEVQTQEQIDNGDELVPLPLVLKTKDQCVAEIKAELVKKAGQFKKNLRIYFNKFKTPPPPPASPITPADFSFSDSDLINAEE